MTSSERLSTLIKALAAIVCLTLCLSSCSLFYDENSRDFTISRETSAQRAASEPEFDGYDRDEIAKLLQNDRFIHSVFVGGYFSDGKYTETYAESDYLYQDLIDLINATYSKDSGMLDYCLSLPDYGDDAIRCGVDGNVEYIYHYIDNLEIDVTSFHVTEEAVICGDVSLPIVVETSGLKLGSSLYLGNEYNLEYPVGACMNTGSADRLGGRVLAAVLMLSDAGEMIDEGEKAEYESVIDTALASVTELVTGCGYELQIDKKVISLTHSGESIGSSEYPNALDMALAATSFHSLAGLVGATANIDEYDSYFVIVCADTLEGCSDITYSADMADTFACERIMCGKYLIDTDCEEAIFRLYGAQADRDSLLLEYIGTDVMSGGTGISVINQYRLGLQTSLHRQLCKFIS